MPTTMKRLLYAQLEIDARRRPPGYVEAFKARSNLFPTHLEINPDAVAELDTAYPLMATISPPPGEGATPPPVAVNRKIETWPRNPFGMFARGFKLLRTPEDTGLGDTISRLVGPVGGDAYKKWFLEVFGKPCGCSERQEHLNKLFPY